MIPGTTKLSRQNLKAADVELTAAPVDGDDRALTEHRPTH